MYSFTTFIVVMIYLKKKTVSLFKMKIIIQEINSRNSINLPLIKK